MKKWAAFIAMAAMVAMAAGMSAQVLHTKTYGTSGKPTEAMATPDGQYVLVTVDRDRGSSGIDVFHVESDALKKVAFQALGGEGAQGILLIPGTRILAVGASNSGVVFLPLDDTIKGNAKPGVVAQGERSGSGYLAVTPDGKYLFVANEYGQGGNLGVIALSRNEQGVMAPKTIGHIPILQTAPGVTISADGKRVYAVGEVVPEDWAARFAGHGVSELQRSSCVQGGPRATANGVLYTIDVAKAAAMPEGASGREARAPAISWVDSGCSPVREAVSSDGAMVYVTARGDNKVLVFDAKKLESDAAHAFVRAIATGGEAPVGLKLFDDDKMLLVANSNRFSGGNGNATVIDLASGTVKQKISTGEFPRNITASPDGKTLYLTIFNGNELMVLRQ
jgi:DNA-binding beta-propeller fold protein YncE